MNRYNRGFIFYIITRTKRAQIISNKFDIFNKHGLYFTKHTFANNHKSSLRIDTPFHYLPIYILADICIPFISIPIHCYSYGRINF